MQLGNRTAHRQAACASSHEHVWGMWLEQPIFRKFVIRESEDIDIGMEGFEMVITSGVMCSFHLILYP